MRVFKYGLLPPTSNELEIRRQLRALHEYRNYLVMIERARREAIRAVDRASPEVLEAETGLIAATRSAKREARKRLHEARANARAAAAERMADIEVKEKELLIAARTLTPSYWGSYIQVEAAHRQSRQQQLYDGVKPNDPAFVSGPKWRNAFAPDDPRGVWWLAPGRLGVQFQNGITVRKALEGTDTRLRICLGPPQKRGRRYGKLYVRVSSDDRRRPVWGEWPIKTHRDLPELAVIRTAYVSLRSEGLTEKWTVELTLDESACPSRPSRKAGVGAVAIEWEWAANDDGTMRVARYADARGVQTIDLPARLVQGIGKPSGITSYRDVLLNQLRPVLADLIKSRTDVPRWLAEAGNVLHLWKNHNRFLEMEMRFRLENLQRVSHLKPVSNLLLAWAKRERHLRAYETGARGEALRERLEFYRVLAARWRERYGTVLLSDQNLAKESRFGDDSALQVVAAPADLRTSLRNAFGRDAIDARFRDGGGMTEDDESWWCERALAKWRMRNELTEQARGLLFKEREETPKEKGGAWAARKKKTESGG